jgi:spermidine synthase
MPHPLLLYTVVTLSGGCVLALEILGTRILGPYYGVSLFLWSALITVTLAALSVGYAVGGRWADKGPTMQRLAVTLLLAGLWTMLIPWVKRPLLDLAVGLGLRTSVILVSTILFGPPLLLLGIVSPYAVRLRAQSLESVGRTAGNLYAVSTLASVLSAVATGFWLIPNVGIQRLTMGIGAVLIAAAALAAFGGRGTRRSALAAAIAIGMALLTAFGPVSASARSERVVFHGQSAYAQIRVLDREDVRYLVLDGGLHSSFDFADGGSWHPYACVLDLAKHYFDAPGRMLLVGLGGGSVAASYARDGWTVDAVEIDALVAQVAREYFDLEPELANVILMDGRRFLQESQTEYDLIVFDAFGSSSIPFHLITREVFALVESRLSAGGVFAINLEAVGWRHPLVLSVAHTMRTSFQNVIALPIPEPPTSLGNVVLLAMNREDVDRPETLLEHPSDHLADSADHFRTVERFHAWNNRFEPEVDAGQLLTDDRNPADLWAEEINRVARHQLIREFFEKDEWSW